MKEFFNKWGRWILGGGQPDEEQSQASGGTARPRTENEKTTGTTRPNPGEARRGKDPAREKEIEIKWDPEQGCLVVETKQGLELGLRKFMFELSEGEVHVERTKNVQRPELTITERIFADSEPEARRFYKQKGSGVNVSAGPESLYVKGESSSGVVSAGSRSVQIEGISGGVVIVDSDIGGNISNIVNGGTGGAVIINGKQTGSSQPVARRETRVVLRVPVAENVSEGEKPKPEYIIEVGAGNITFENANGEYDVSVGAGNITFENANGEYDVSVGAGNTVFKECDIVRSRVTNTAGNIEVIDGVFIGKNNTFKTEAGNISVKFGRGQGEIEVQTSSGGGAIRRTQSFFEGVKNPDGQTAILRLTAKAGKIEVNE